MSRHSEQYIFDPAELTFGLEFGFGIKFPLPNANPRHPHINISHTSEYDAQDYVASFINQRVTNATVLSFRQYCSAHPPLEHGEPVPLDTEWVLTSDTTVNFYVEQAQTQIPHFGFELKSPVLRYEDIDSFSNQVHNVLKVLNSNFDVVTNHTCGFHVHVGRALAGFDIAPLRNLMATLWVFEPHISAIHPPSRHNNPFSSSLGLLSPIARVARHRKWTSEETLNRLLAFASVNELVAAYAPGAHLEWNICKMSYEVGFLKEPFPFHEHTKRTVEFRQHAGTTEFGEVWRWVRFVRDVVVWAHTKHPNYVRYFLRRWVARRTHQYRFADLCEEIGTTVPPRG